MSAAESSHPAWITPYGQRLLDALVDTKRAVEAVHNSRGVEGVPLPDFTLPCPACDDPITASQQVAGAGGAITHAVPMCADFARWYEDR